MVAVRAERAGPAWVHSAQPPNSQRGLGGQQTRRPRSLSRHYGENRVRASQWRRASGKIDHCACTAGHRKVRRSGLSGDLVVADLPAGISFRTPDGSGAPPGVDSQARDAKQMALDLREELPKKNGMQ